MSEQDRIKEELRFIVSSGRMLSGTSCGALREALIRRATILRKRLRQLQAG